MAASDGNICHISIVSVLLFLKQRLGCLKKINYIMERIKVMKNKKIKSLAMITALAMAATPIMGISAFADEFDDAIIFEDVLASSYTSAQQAAYTAITQACTEFLNSSVSLSTNYFKVIKLNEGLSKAEIEQLVSDIKKSGNYPVLAGVNLYSTAGTDTYDKLALLTKEEYRTAAGREALKTTLSITKQPTDVTAAIGTEAEISVEATGNNLTYQWYYSNDNGKTWAVSLQKGNKTKKLTVGVTAARIGMQFKCVITDGSGNTVTSNVVTLYNEA